jgi:hypothetical protein
VNHPEAVPFHPLRGHKSTPDGAPAQAGLVVIVLIAHGEVSLAGLGEVRSTPSIGHFRGGTTAVSAATAPVGSISPCVEGSHMTIWPVGADISSSSWPGIAVRRTASLALAYDPAIRAFVSTVKKDVDAQAFAAPKGLRPRRRDKPAHDG